MKLFFISAFFFSRIMVTLIVNYLCYTLFWFRTWTHRSVLREKGRRVEKNRQKLKNVLQSLCLWRARDFSCFFHAKHFRRTARIETHQGVQIWTMQSIRNGLQWLQRRRIQIPESLRVPLYRTVRLWIAQYNESVLV